MRVSMAGIRSAQLWGLGQLLLAEGQSSYPAVQMRRLDFGYLHMGRGSVRATALLRYTCLYDHNDGTRGKVNCTHTSIFSSLVAPGL